MKPIRDRFETTVEIIPGKRYLDRLYWVSDDTPPRNNAKAYYFCIDDVNYRQDLVYTPFCSDFGPLNLAMTHKFCNELDKLLQCSDFATDILYHYTTLKPHKRANAAYLMGAFQIIVLGRSAEDAWRGFSNLSSFESFRDASFNDNNFKLPILYCLKAIENAIKHRWYNYDTFNIDDYNHYSKFENGDISWILPNKLLAFSSPTTGFYNNQSFSNTTEKYCSIFSKLGVSAVIRLNKATYQPEVSNIQSFIDNGILHYDLYFPDGSCPSEDQVKEFIQIVNNYQGAVAVHCKAGLGRTGTMIGCYIMANYEISSLEIIAWIRICRPGSILGPQQHFLTSMERRCKEWRNGSELERYAETQFYLSFELSPKDRYISNYGEKGQADMLINVKHLNQSTGVSTAPTPTAALSNRSFPEEAAPNKCLSARGDSNFLSTTYAIRQAISLHVRSS